MTDTKSSANTTNEGNYQTNVKLNKAFFLRVIIYYTKDGEKSFEEAAGFLRNRLEEKYPADKNNKVKLLPVTSVSDFNKAWVEVKKLSDKEEYHLKRIHFVGHGGETALYFLKSVLNLSEVTKLSALNWAEDSIFVIHACKTGHEYQNSEGNKVECIAREFSKKQKTRVLGQIVGANFSSKQETRKYAILSKSKAYLWAYRSGNSVKTFVTDPKSIGYNLYKEYEKLDDNALWACQAFRNGNALYRNIKTISTDLYFM